MDRLVGGGEPADDKVVEAAEGGLVVSGAACGHTEGLAAGMTRCTLSLAFHLPGGDCGGRDVVFFKGRSSLLVNVLPTSTLEPT